MPLIEHSSSSADSFRSLKVVLETACLEDACISDPLAEISFKAGCASMGFQHRTNYKTALKRQRDMDALGKVVAGAHLPESHWKDGSQHFFIRDILAYRAAARSE